MKRFFIILSVALVTIFGAIVVSANTTNETEPHVEYTIPGVAKDCTFSFTSIEAIYNLLPYNVREVMTASYQDVIRLARSSSSFTYNGVQVKHPSETSWEFYYNGCSFKISNVTKAQLDEMFFDGVD